MPRLLYQVPKYRHFKARNLAFVMLDGQKIYLGKWKSKESLALYDKLLSTWLQGDRQLSLDLLRLAGTVGTAVEQANTSAVLTVQQLADKYNEHAQQYYRKRGKITREAGCIKEALAIACAECGETFACEFGPARLKQARQAMVTKGWSRLYINKQVDRLRRAFGWAVEGELLEAGPKYRALAKVRCLAKGRTTARETDPVQPVSDKTITATLLHLSPIVADMVRLQRATGMRPSELCAITPGAVDRSGKVWLYSVDGHKMEHTGSERVVAIGPRGQRVLRKYLLRAADQPCFSPREAEAARREEMHTRRKTPLNYGNRPGSNRSDNPQRPIGQTYTADSYRRAITRACQQAGIAAWHPNQLRHTRATEVRAQAGLEAAQCVLGHSSAQTTEIYALRNLQLAIDVARQTG